MKENSLLTCLLRAEKHSLSPQEFFPCDSRQNREINSVILAEFFDENIFNLFTASSETAVSETAVSELQK